LRHLSVTFLLLAFGAQAVAWAQSRFQVPLVVSNGLYVMVHRLGVDPRATAGVDRDTLLGAFLESGAPPLPPSPFPMDSRLVTIPGRSQEYPTGLAGGVYRDFRDFRDTAQVDSFLVRIQGMYLLNAPTVVSWPPDLGRFAASWSIRSLGSAAVPPADMMKAVSVTIAPDPLAGVYNLLIIKGGARAPAFPAGAVDRIINGAGSYRFDQGTNPYDVESNQTAVFIDFSLAAGPGAVTVERYTGSARDLQFSGPPPVHLGKYRWVISHTGLTAFSARISFEHTMFSSNVTDQNSVIVYWRPTEGNGTFAPLPPASPTDPLLVRVNVTAFGEFIFGANDDQLDGIARPAEVRPAFRLDQNYPNPFNPETTIRYSLPYADRVSVSVFDILGREVARLVNGFQPAGEHGVTFSAAGLSSGVYIYHLESGAQRITRKMIHMK